MSRAVIDTSVFIAQEAGGELRDLPEELAVSVVTAAELELGVLRASAPEVRAIRLATLSRVRAVYPLLATDAATASCFARIAASELARGRRLREHDTWIAATAMRYRAAVLTRDADFSSFAGVEVIRV